MSEAYAEQDDQHFTYADYKAWELKPGERYELIYGVPYAMSAPNTAHQRISMLLSGALSTFLINKPCEAFAAPFDIRLFYAEDESDNTVVQPDLVVVCDRQKLGEEGCRGAPDLVIEILSPSNTAVEMERKLNLYREAGVREYWLIDPQNKHICIYRLQSNEFAIWVNRPEDVARSTVLPGLEIRLSEVFAGS